MDSGEGMFQALLHQTREIVLVMQSNGKIIEINQAAIEAYGYSREELLSMNMDELQEPDTLPVIDGQSQQGLENEISYETCHKRKDGSKFSVEVSSQAFHNDNEIGIICVIRDTSKRVRATKTIRNKVCEFDDMEPEEATIRAREESIKRKYDAITAGIVVQDLDGVVIYANKMAEKILDFALDEMKGKSARNSAVKVIDESGRELSLEELPSMITARTGAVVPARVIGLHYPDVGKAKWILVSSAPVMDVRENKMTEVIATLIDITSRYYVHTDLRASEDRLRFALGCISAAEWTLALDTFQMDYSMQFANIIGQSDKSSGSLSSFLECIAMDDRGRVARILEESVLCGGSFDIECRIDQTDGGVKWIQLAGKVRDSVVERRRTMDGIAIDITDKKRAESVRNSRMIRQQQRLMGEMIGCLDAPFFLVDLDFRLVTFNRNFADAMRFMFDIDVELGCNLLQYISVEKDREKIERHLKQVFNGEVLVKEDYAGKEGEQRSSFEIVHYPVQHEDGKIIGAATFFRDITARKKMEEELQSSEKRYRQLIEDTNLIIIQADKLGGITYINDYGCQFFGYPSQDLIGIDFHDYLFSDVDDLLGESQNILELENETTQRVVRAHFTSTGQRVWVEWTLRWETDKSKQFHGLSAVGVDVSRSIRGRLEGERRFQRSLQRDLMNNAIFHGTAQGELVEQARKLGFLIPERFLCMIFCEKEKSFREQSTPEEEQSRQDLLIDWLQKKVEGGIVWQSPDGVAVICDIPGNADNFYRAMPVDAGHKILGWIEQYEPRTRWSCGISQISQHVKTLAEVYRQAMLALTFLQRMHQDRCIFHWNDLGGMRLLIKDVYSADSTQYIEDQLGPLLRLRDKERLEELLVTLRELVACDSVETIANHLHVHVGTVRYRKKTLGKILGVDLEKTENLVDLSLALSIMNMRESLHDIKCGDNA